MNGSPLAYLAIGLIIGGSVMAGVVAAQATDRVDDSREWKESGQTCLGFVIDELNAATNTNQDLESQEKHLNAANAYRQLATEGYDC